jgi:hypothetical protein
VNFAYSLLAGMITGNVNIVRVPSKTFPQVQIIVNALVYVLNQSKYQAQLASRVYLVRYSRDNLATEFFSSFCDVRIIWGGDRTIEEIRQAPIPAKSTEITFSANLPRKTGLVSGKSGVSCLPHPISNRTDPSVFRNGQWCSDFSESILNSCIFYIFSLE